MISVKQAKKERIIRKAKREKSRRHIIDFIKYTFRQYKQENWHHHLVSSYYEKAIKGEIRRLMVWLPPRAMKTEGLERAVAWGYGHNPNLKVIGCAYGATRASDTSKKIKQNIKDTLFADVFNEFKGGGIFKDTIDKQDQWEIGGGNRGGYLSAGVNGPITGFGGELLLVDDPVKSRQDAESPTYQITTKEWYFGTLLNRQNDKDSSIIIINTRWNTKDLCGSILEMEGIKTYNGHKPVEGTPEWNGRPDGKWDILCLPAEMDEEAYEWKHKDDPRELGEALWPERFPTEFLQQFKLIKYDWYSLYQGRPQVKGGNMINRAWFKEPVLDFPRGGKLIRFWDLASTAKEASKHNNPDFTAGALLTYVNGMVYIIDIVATQIATKAKYDLMKQTAVLDDQMYGSVMQIWEEEGGASGKDVTVTLNELLDAHLRAPMRVRKSKNFYIELLANKAETGNVRVVKGPWLHKKRDNATFFDSAEAFPSKLVHDDDIDATSKGCFLLTGGIIDDADGNHDQKEYEAETITTETEKQTDFQLYEKQILTNKRIDDKTIDNIDETMVILEQISDKYIELNNSDLADLILDEKDRIENLKGGE